MELKIRYYSDEVHDDFANTNIKTEPLPKDFKYNKNDIFSRLRRFIVYRVLATPAVFFIQKVLRGVKYVNKGCLKGYKKQGCFIYGNHTGFASDAFNPTVISFPRPAKVMVNEDSTSIKGLRRLLMDVGALPIPSGLHLMGAFNGEIDRAIKAGYWIAIYPEAHIWPYYTGVRNFPAVSFRYPAKLGAPVFTYTMTFRKRRFFKSPKKVVYIDGPFLPDPDLPVKAAQQKLRDEAYAAMSARAAQFSTYEYKYKYVYRPEEVSETLSEIAVSDERENSVSAAPANDFSSEAAGLSEDLVQ